MDDDEENRSRHFIGFDFSTQQIKAVVINEQLEVTAQAHVHFDSMLPEYRTHGGVHISGREHMAGGVHISGIKDAGESYINQDPTGNGIKS